ncbi:uncharacterized protein LOC129573408 [Sitodiplosis mosellana]|uniref:uncharacterized protein LOC129573408 n=1 Tax=Sitodiplosis mosellana TaxID=263140 RepID=UPI0024448B53|nr:uncharacterized protein LOC129573408 [Sitodiplosis mosellana]
MENGQSNRFLKWKRTAKTLGIMFGLTFMIYFAAVSYLVGAKLIIPVLVSVLNLVATGTWLHGLANNKTGFLLLSLMAWGIPLNVMIGLIFYFILQKPLFREIVPIYSAHEIIAFAVTAHFVLFYFVLIVSYRSIKLHGRRTESDFDWKIVGIAVGWLVLAFSIGLTTFFIYLSVIYKATIALLVTCLIFGEMNFLFNFFFNV